MELYSTLDFLKDFYNRIPDEDKAEMLKMYKQAMKDTFKNCENTVKENKQCFKKECIILDLN